MRVKGTMDEKNKGIFAGLTLFAISILVIINFGIVKLTNSQLLGGRFIAIFNLILTAIIGSFGAVTLFLVAALYFNWKIPCFSFNQKIYHRILFPLIIFSGRILNIPRERIQQSLIDINNNIVKLRGIKVKPDELLLLLPHCLQNSNCRIKLINNLANCCRCGECSIKDLSEIGINQKIRLSLAKGGTEARKILGEIKPKAVIAVACERDLISGIIDSYPISVYGIINNRPFGYCKDTCINLRAIRDGIEFFLGEEIAS